MIGSASASSPASSPGKIGLPGTPLGDLALTLSIIQGQCPGKAHCGMVDHGVCQRKKQVQLHHTSTASPAGPLLGPNEHHLLGTKLQNRIPERKQVRLLFSEKKNASSSNFGVPLEFILTVYLWVLLTLGLETAIFCRQTSEQCILTSWWFYRSTQTDIYIYIYI